MDRIIGIARSGALLSLAWPDQGIVQLYFPMQTTRTRQSGGFRTATARGKDRVISSQQRENERSMADVLFPGELTLDCAKHANDQVMRAWFDGSMQLCTDEADVSSA